MNLTTIQTENLKGMLCDYLALLEEVMGAQYHSSNKIAGIDDMLKALEGQAE